eukprot:COSAG01_NODE_83_length_27807_cov_20.014581_15_plen_66_part_00
MGSERWKANITLYGVQIYLGAWLTDGTQEERRTKDATPDGRDSISDQQQMGGNATALKRKPKLDL